MHVCVCVRACVHVCGVCSICIASGLASLPLPLVLGVETGSSGHKHLYLLSHVTASLPSYHFYSLVAKVEK